MHSAPSITKLALAGVAGIGLALVGVAVPASAADPAGAMTVSQFYISQTGSTMSIDFITTLADPAAPGTVVLNISNYTSCTTTADIQIVVPITTDGNHHTDVQLSTTNKTYIDLLNTNGTDLISQNMHGYTSSNSAPSPMTATITPDVDPATGTVQLVTGVERWQHGFQFEIDGVATTSQPTLQPACTTASYPYAGLAYGSTLAVVATDVTHTQLATLTNSAAPVVVPPSPLVPVSLAGAAARAEPTLALTGFDGTPYGIVGGLLSALGLGFLVWSIHTRKRALAG